MGGAFFFLSFQPRGPNAFSAHTAHPPPYKPCLCNVFVFLFFLFCETAVLHYFLFRRWTHNGLAHPEQTTLGPPREPLLAA